MWNHTICGLLCLLLSFSIKFSRLIHVIPCMSLFTVNKWWISIVWIYHILFVHSLIDEHWCVSTFLPLWLMLLWTFMYNILCQHMFSFLLNIYLGMKFLGQIITLFLSFWGTDRPFSKVAASFYIPISSLWGSNFSTFLMLVIICLFYYSHSIKFWLYHS